MRHYSTLSQQNPKKKENSHLKFNSGDIFFWLCLLEDSYSIPSQPSQSKSLHRRNPNSHLGSLAKATLSSQLLPALSRSLWSRSNNTIKSSNKNFNFSLLMPFHYPIAPSKRPRWPNSLTIWSLFQQQAASIRLHWGLFLKKCLVTALLKKYSY